MELPSCALIGRRETVIVRIMDSCGACHMPGVRDWWPSDRTDTKCELCRVQLINKSSGCDSVPIERCQPYRFARMRIRYINVYAAVCLLLLVGSLPQSSAAPTKNMESKPFWEDDCNFQQQEPPKNIHINKTDQVETIVTYSKRVIRRAREYENDVANITLDYSTMETLLLEYDNYSWLKENYTYIFGVDFKEEVLPKTKIYNSTVPDEYVELIAEEKKLNEILPDLYKTMKLVVASFDKLVETYNDFSSDEASYLAFPGKMKTIQNEMSYLLCPLHLLALDTKHLDNTPIIMDKIDFTQRKHEQAFLVFRDSINFVQYLLQIFEKLDGRYSSLESSDS